MGVNIRDYAQTITPVIARKVHQHLTRQSRMFKIRRRSRQRIYPQESSTINRQIKLPSAANKNGLPRSLTFARNDGETTV